MFIKTHLNTTHSKSCKLRFKNHFVLKLTSIFLIITVLPLILISIIFYRINVTASYNKITEAVQLTTRQLIQQLEARFTQMENVSDTIQYYMYSLPVESSQSISKQLDSFSQLRTNISTLESTFAFDHICIFLNEDSIFSEEGLMFYSLEELKDFGVSENVLLESDTESVWMYIPQQSYPFMLNHTYLPMDAILCVRSLQNTPDSLKYAYFISIDAAEFTDLISSAYKDTGISGYLLDTSGRIIATSNVAALNDNIHFTEEQLQNFIKYSQFKENSSLYYSEKLSNSWMFITDVSDRFIRSNTSEYVRTFLIVLLIVIPVAAVLIVFLTKSLTKRIALLSESASKVDFSQNQFHGVAVEYIKNKPEKNFDEVDHLALTYNQMMQMIYENIDHITMLRAQEETLKYQLLQSLINPHFLYNILDSIATCNRIGKPELANKMIMNLTRFYRMTLRKSNELIAIRDELEIARLYMELESICRGGNFTWDISMDEEIENFMICKFTLQPFIENSILHGMQGFDQHLHIQIDIRYGEDTIQIFITDNGHGIPPEKLQELQDSIASKLVDTSRHFGICNVNARISSELFGYGFIEIDSKLDEGTSVKIEFQQILP